MEGSHYSPDGLASSSATAYPSPSTRSSTAQPEQQQQYHNQVLPPILDQNKNNHAWKIMYAGSHAQPPHGQANPGAAAPSSNLPSYHQQTTQASSRGPAYAMSGPPSFPSPHAFSMPQTTQAMSHPQPIAPAPPAGRGAPVLRPMPGVMNQQGVMGNPMMQQGPGLQEGEQPTHVVGSQGRRGILPSAPGRVPVGQVNSKGQITPVKDADGKFPCPHCTKTYLHAKHLKRHLLRHTGDRPYRCVLCNDTFSRSDILKRHFQKCSIRRGNPAGVTHLSLPQAHVKKSQPPVQKAPAPVGIEGDLNHLNGGLGNMPGDGMSHGYPMVPVPEGLPNLANDQSQMQRSNMSRIESNGSQDRQGMAAPVMGSAPGRGYEQHYASNVAGSMANQPMQGYSMPPGQNGMPMYAGGSNSNQQVDWSQVFPTGAQDSYANAFPPNIGQTQIPVKQEPNIENDRTDGVPGVHPTDSLFFANYMPPTTHNPYVLLSNQLQAFFQTLASTYPNQHDLDTAHSFFTPENIKDFLDKYTHFHIHFPLIHVPSVRITEMNTGLLAGLCCVGACYSDRVSPDHVRDVMDLVRPAFEQQSNLLTKDWQQQGFPSSLSKDDVDEMQAIILIAALHVWHGTPLQREWGQRRYALLAVIARDAGLLRITPESRPYSPLHQPGFSPQNFDVSSFDWNTWVEQERRIRVVHVIFLADTAMSLYFNMTPRLDSFEMNIPLPCDDGAWDARADVDCAAALGLYGPEAAREKSSDGTHRAKQPEMSLALQALLHGSYQIQPGRTNLYGKFILIHAIIAIIRKALVDQNAATMVKEMGTPPLHEWMVRDTGSSDGRATPVEGAGQQIPLQTRQALSTALDKFKANWDADMVTQFPPQIQAKNPRRYGFSRDGIHFYWLAKYMLKHTRPTDLQLPPDGRFAQVMQLLRSVKTWVMTDGASRGEALGSVGDINKDYGVSDRTLNMAQLFTPLPKVVDDPRIPSVKTDIDTGIM
ncbi:hypothetical protein jhhlp_003524 [Lomentospora prolificans]|uniref:C2H2-type domain-containing protein n=1 Tax=Lomentospora prolificans TaxID=41688 RepID=A0A2N3N900_9PEZI|nr:hypothetical protein jhhlp_003524 [Lomentospora prolificans]